MSEKISFQSATESSMEVENKYGENVLLDIEFARHGKKGSFNAARIENVEETSRLAQDADLSTYDVVAVRTTPVERAVHTALAMREGFERNETVEQDGGVNVRVRELPTGIISEAGVNIEKIMKESSVTKDANLISASIREQYKQAVLSTEGSTWAKENAGVESFVRIMQSNVKELECVVADLSESRELSVESKLAVETFRRNSVENGMSMLEVVLRMAKNIDHYVKVTNRLKTGSKAFIHEVNHSGFIEPFLIYLLDEQIRFNPVVAEGNSDLEKLGGGLEPNESIRISIKREHHDGSVKILFLVRGNEYEIDEKKLEHAGSLLDLIKSHE